MCISLGLNCVRAHIVLYGRKGKNTGLEKRLGKIGKLYSCNGLGGVIVCDLDPIVHIFWDIQPTLLNTALGKKVY